MNLRDQFIEDLDLFFDPDEMASEHELEGRLLRLVIDDDQMQKNALQAPGGLYDGDILLFVKTGDLAGLELAPGRMIRLDRRPYQILSALDLDGITQLTLQTEAGR